MRFYPNIENLVLGARVSFNGFAGKNGLFWSTGVVECWKTQKPYLQLEKSLLHHSTTPAVSRTKERP
jgi:hypothetical protein